MANRLLTTCLRPAVQFQKRTMFTFDRVGNRDVVGFGYNGEPAYIDKTDFPMPAIRWKENTPDVMALREKEKGDWKKLSIEEKKALYRASFRQTFVELEAPTGEWKGVIGGVCMIFTAALWFFLYIKTFVHPKPPKSISLESRLAQLDRIKKLDMNPIEGICARK